MGPEAVVLEVGQGALEPLAGVQAQAETGRDRAGGERLGGRAERWAAFIVVLGELARLPRADRVTR